MRGGRKATGVAGLPSPLRTARWIRDTFPGAPPASHLLFRAVLLVSVVFVGDRITVSMEHRGWILGRDAVIAVRLLTALPVLRFPLEGMVVAMEVDKWDWYWLSTGTQPEASQTLYQEWDKALDLFPLALALVAARAWDDPTMRRLLAATFALRVVGVAAFLATQQRWLMVAFPNVVENLFLIWVVFRLLAGRDRLVEGRRTLAAVFGIALAPKLAAEYFLHYIERRPWDWVDLPMPDGWEPRAWVVAAYLPALLVTLALASRAGRRAVDEAGRVGENRPAQG